MIDHIRTEELLREWPATRQVFDTLRGRWKCIYIDAMNLSFACTRVRLKLCQAEPDPRWTGPAQRWLVLLHVEQGLVDDLHESDRLNLAVLDFLDSPCIGDVRWA